eukprot:TRINITY_DN22363_c0_g1_i1.p1 TRINITY_DN22363_c0_g1~~TRINITY_DN22363_c0_g1_i1.p1  ORF type:complete len:217 (+),score=15.17 TRINITY_DN22363_c0_g1_i1:81-731(+)
MCIRDRNEGAFSIVSLIAGSKSPVVLRRIAISELPDTGGKLSIDIYMKMNYTYSGILAFISRNFDWLHNSASLPKLNKAELLIFLKHKHLNVKREEEVLIALFIWCILLHDSLDKNHRDENIKDLLENVRWEFISIESLLDIVNNFPLLRANKAFQAKFKKEMMRRLRNEVVQSMPRKSYKFQIDHKATQSFLFTLSNALLEQKTDLSLLINSLPT